jgi:hypothetical protein
LTVCPSAVLAGTLTVKETVTVLFSNCEGTAASAGAPARQAAIALPPSPNIEE